MTSASWRHDDEGAEGREPYKAVNDRYAAIVLDALRARVDWQQEVDVPNARHLGAMTGLLPASALLGPQTLADNLELKIDLSCGPR